MTLAERLSEVVLLGSFSSLCGRRFRLVDGNNDEVFAGTISSIGIAKRGSHKSGWHDCVVIVPEGGCWDIMVDLDRNETLDGVEKGLRWTICLKGTIDKLIFTRLHLVP